MGKVVKIQKVLFCPFVQYYEGDKLAHEEMLKIEICEKDFDKLSKMPELVVEDIKKKMDEKKDEPQLEQKEA